MGFITYVVKKGGIYMSEHFLNVILTVITYACLIYFVFIEISYIYLKFIKKDTRFNKIGLFRYLDSPIKILKGDK